MYEDLIERLRETSMDFGELDNVSAMLIEAADAIENLDEICQLQAEELRNTSQMAGDLISRQAAIDALKRNRLLFCEKRVDFLMLSEKDKARVDEIDTCISELLNLPTVQPERKKGKWVKARGSWCTPGGDPVWECSLCGKGTHVYGIEHGTYGSDIADGQWVSCPNCGAEMGD